MICNAVLLYQKLCIMVDAAVVHAHPSHGVFSTAEESAAGDEWLK